MIAKRLKDLRLKAGKTAKDVARQIGVAESTYRDWENGRLIRGEPYQKIANVLQTSVFYLVTGEGRQSDKIYEDLLKAEELIKNARKCL